jgi:hypothetical protein
MYVKNITIKMQDWIHKNSFLNTNRAKYTIFKM